MRKLTPKQERFANLYVELGNASEAYRGAYSCSRMKSTTINNKAYGLLKRGDIGARVKELQAEVKKRLDLSKDDAVKSLVQIFNANALDFVKVGEKQTEFGPVQVVEIKDLSELTEEQQKCIKSIQPMRSGGIRLELYSRIDAVDRLSKMLGWDEPTKHEIEGKISTIKVEVLDADIKDEIDKLG